MSLALLLAFIAAAILVNLLTRKRGRLYALLVVSAMAVYVLQPALPIRGLDFWFPTATLGLSVLSWVLTSPVEQRVWKDNAPAALILGGIVLLLGLTRLLDVSLPLTASRPPQTLQIILALALLTGFVFTLWRFSRPGSLLTGAAVIFLIGLFIVLKAPALAAAVSAGLRSVTLQSTTTASGLDLRWLGFSYIAFRLLHTLRDRQSGRLPAVTLAEYVVYVIFFPSLSAGPIDRIERFIGDLRSPPTFTGDDWTDAGRRLILGLFKKFALADLLGLISLNATNALQVRSTGWMWVLLYAYALQIYFDFSGYTDIAIGMGRLLGVRLPENFRAPYLKPNLTQFWNNWHITLTQWFRAYFFNPVTRTLRAARKPLPVPAVIFLTQVATMLLIGMWHGMTANFILWGLWHGLGLFVHNRWSERTRAGFAALPAAGQKALNAGGTFLTFNYVALGWVFFALPLPSVSWHVFLKLFGLA
jgi:D-alanyl-lipoteichoic acid acyltransferase DltB (MBOAT superfamily)